MMAADAQSMTKSVIGWTCQYVALPLTPFLSGALVRGLFRRTLHITLFDPAELSFSMAMLCLLVSLSSKSLEDKHLSASLTSSFSIGVFVFAALFTLAIIFEELIKLPGFQGFEENIEVMTWIVVTFSALTAIIAVISKYRYKLGDIVI